MRAQTTLDFAVGVAVFLAVLLFAFTFVPGILSPFDLSGEEEPAVSNRIADSLSQDLLGSPQTPHILDRYCTVEFFNESQDSPPEGCAYSSISLEEQFNLSSTQTVNVTLTADLDSSGEKTQLCWEPEDESIPLDSDEWGLAERGSCSGNGVTLTKGDERPDDGQSTITARRVVSLHDEPVTMEVVVW